MDDRSLRRIPGAGRLRALTLNTANGVKLLFVHDPWGTNIEVNQRPHPL